MKVKLERILSLSQSLFVRVRTVERSYMAVRAAYERSLCESEKRKENKLDLSLSEVIELIN